MSPATKQDPRDARARIPQSGRKRREYRVFFSLAEASCSRSLALIPITSRRVVATRPPSCRTVTSRYVFTRLSREQRSRLYAHPRVQYTPRRLSVRSVETRFAPTRRRVTHTLTARSSRTYPPFDRRGTATPRLSAPPRSVSPLGTPVKHVDLRRHSEFALATADCHAGRPTAVGDSKTCHSPRADAGRAHVPKFTHVRDLAAHFRTRKISARSRYVARGRTTRLCHLGATSVPGRFRFTHRATVTAFRRQACNPNRAVGTRACARDQQGRRPGAATRDARRPGA